MRVVHVYSGNLYGGVERMLGSMAKSDAFTDHRFLLCFEGRLATELRAANAQVRVLPSPRLRDPLSIFRYRRTLTSELKLNRPVKVICHGVWSYCMAGATVRRLGLEPTLFLHDVPEPSKLLYRWAWLRPPALCITNSEFVRRGVADLGGSVPTAIVHPLVPPTSPPSSDQTHALRRSFGVGDDELVILQASRLDPWKGHRTLLQALALLKDTRGWRAWIAGAPQRAEEQRYLDELTATTQSLGLGERVRFIGHRSDMPLVLAASDIYCQPNEQPEPFGMVFVEALGLGKPVVAGDRGGVREIVSSDCGRLCPSDAATVSLALKELLVDSTLRERMGSAGRARASLFGPEAFARSLAAALAR